nr:MAG TPA: hypothetical protein [Caudoviricetes sp.]
MKVKFIGQGSPLSLLNGKEYAVESVECGWYRIVDETGEDYLYPPQSFEVVEALPVPPETYPEPMPRDMLAEVI